MWLGVGQSVIHSLLFSPPLPATHARVLNAGPRLVLLAATLGLGCDGGEHGGTTFFGGSVTSGTPSFEDGNGLPPYQDPEGGTSTGGAGDSTFGDSGTTGATETDETTAASATTAATETGPAWCEDGSVIELGSVLPVHEVGDTVAEDNDHAPSCFRQCAADAAFSWTAPAGGLYTIDTAGSSYDTGLYVLDGACGEGKELACNDDALGLFSGLSMELVAGQTITIIVDGYGLEEGSFQLNIQAGMIYECLGWRDCGPEEYCGDGSCWPVVTGGSSDGGWPPGGASGSASASEGGGWPTGGGWSTSGGPTGGDWPTGGGWSTSGGPTGGDWPTGGGSGSGGWSSTSGSEDGADTDGGDDLCDFWGGGSTT